MPKRYKPNKYSNVSSLLCQNQGFGQEETWDDSELISQFDEALREWKQERLNALQNNENDTDIEDAPQMGAWVEVVPETFDPVVAAQTSDVVSALDDLEMMSLYDEGLREWKEERKPENWGNILQESLAAASVSDSNMNTDPVPDPEDSAKPGPWVVVNPENDLEILRSKALAYSIERSQLSENPRTAGQEDDREILTVYDEALQEWKEERRLSGNQDQPAETSGLSESQSPSQQYEIGEPQSQENNTKLESTIQSDPVSPTTSVAVEA